MTSSENLRHDDEQAEHRRVERDSLLLKASLRMSGYNETFPIRVRNLSSAGLMAEAAFPVDHGARVVIDLHNLGGVPGMVAWVVDKRFGVAFDDEIDPKSVRFAPPPRDPGPVDALSRRPIMVGKALGAKPARSL